MSDTDIGNQPVLRRHVLRGLGAIVILGITAVSPASAHPPEEFPGSATGEKTSKKGRENAVERGQGTGNPPGTGEDGGSGGPVGNPGQ